ncbi:unnamed protein product [Blepharisma stoltei]|uniref:Sphingomyelin phosphodiesterase n=1 Tax=Blepharisma stoltei TaxID=1481888 RepID=A0AAU9IKC3_9CILI|nr:unnamed protein product [Blepharisma stoltei]
MRMILTIAFAVLALQVTARRKPDCLQCHAIVEALKDAVGSGAFLDSGADILIGICSLFEHHEVCKGLVDIYGPGYAENTIAKFLSPDYVCSKIGSCAHPEYLLENLTQYEREVLQDMPEIQPWPQTGNETFFVLQVTDMHIDFFYQPGSEVDCNYPLCCRSGNGTAGYWGSRASCDTPPQTAIAFLEQIKNLPISFVVWTGDNPPHDVWAYEREKEMNVTIKLTQMFKDYLQVPMFPIIGNHDCFPMDFFHPGHEQVLLGNLTSLWGEWLGPDQIQQFSQNGYYSALEPTTGFRIIGLNNQLGDNMNGWLIPNNTDPAGMLAWLRTELYQAEANNEPVIILGHIPHGDKYIDSTWSRHFRTLVNRFQNTIRGQFFGHTHQDEFFVVHSLIPGADPAGVYIAAPSFGTYSDQNPSFRLYEYDVKTHHLVNIHQYRLPLYTANQNTESATFEEVFNFKDEYSMPDMSPLSFAALADQVLDDEATGQKFYANWLAQYPFEAKKCDKKCQKYLYCRLSNDVFNDVFACDEEAGFSKYIFGLLLESAQGPWEYLIE